MLSRCQLSGNLKTASTSLLDVFPVKRFPKASRPRPSSIWTSSSRGIAGKSSDFDTFTQSGLADEGSLWSNDSWDDVFKDLEEPLSLSKGKKPSRPAFSSQPPRRATLNERESKVLSEMMDMVWASKGPKAESDLNSFGIKTKPKDSEISPSDSSSSQKTERGVDRGKYRPQNELLDKKKEEMSACENDQQLLEWATREVFDESRRCEEVARNAFQKAEMNGSEVEIPPLQSPAYPHLVAHLIKTFRDQFQDPHLAIFIFNYAKNLSTVSYVFGCSTDAYNELIQTHWISFKDIEGVAAAVDEMVVNGVPFNDTTYKIVDHIRWEMGETNMHNPREHSIKGWQIFNRIEQIMKPKKQHGFHGWKSDSDKFDPGETFNDWSFTEDIRKESSILRSGGKVTSGEGRRVRNNDRFTLS